MKYKIGSKTTTWASLDYSLSRVGLASLYADIDNFQKIIEEVSNIEPDIYTVCKFNLTDLMERTKQIEKELAMIENEDAQNKQMYNQLVNLSVNIQKQNIEYLELVLENYISK